MGLLPKPDPLMFIECYKQFKSTGNSIGFGDTSHDTFLSVVDTPIALNPDFSLKELSQKKDWLCYEKENNLDEFMKKVNEKTISTLVDGDYPPAFFDIDGTLVDGVLLLDFTKELFGKIMANPFERIQHIIEGDKPTKKETRKMKDYLAELSKKVDDADALWKEYTRNKTPIIYEAAAANIIHSYAHIAPYFSDEERKIIARDVCDKIKLHPYAQKVFDSIKGRYFTIAMSAEPLEILLALKNKFSFDSMLGLSLSQYKILDGIKSTMSSFEKDNGIEKKYRYFYIPLNLYPQYKTLELVNDVYTEMIRSLVSAQQLSSLVRYQTELLKRMKR